MNKTSTLSYRIHNFNSLLAPELYDVKSLIDIRVDYPEIYSHLQEHEYDVRQEIVDAILRKASTL